MQVRDRLDLFPLRQMIGATGDAALVFARQGLLDWLSKPDRFQIIGHGQGGQILAASEVALADARALLHRTYGDLITFRPATVHTYVDAQAGTLMVPIMFVRIDAPRRHMHDLLQLLKALTASVKESAVQRDRAVLRAELEFARAFGLERQVEELTDGSAHVLSWLLRYQRPAPGAAG